VRRRDSLFSRRPLQNSRITVPSNGVARLWYVRIIATFAWFLRGAKVTIGHANTDAGFQPAEKNCNGAILELAVRELASEATD
jgi:hypothetical protein